MKRTLFLLVLVSLVLADVGCTCFKHKFGCDRRCDTPPPCPPPPVYGGPIAGPPVAGAPPAVHYGGPPGHYAVPR